MRTVFLGTSQFAAAILERLARGAPSGTGHDPLPSAASTAPPFDVGPYRPMLVLTRPDRPAGRGRRLQSPPVAHAARALGIELAQPSGVNDDATRELIARAEPNVVVVCAFGALIKEPLLSEYELLNVHPSLLPRWRGAAPVERAIMAGDACTGVSIMRLTAGLDSGPLCLSQSEPIHARDTYGSLVARLERIGAELLERALDALARGEPLAFAGQDDTKATYAEKITAADRLLDPSRPAAELERTVRALHPHIGARLQLPGGELLGVLRAQAFSEPGPPARTSGPQRGSGSKQAAHGPAPGAVGTVEGRLLYGTAQGALELLEVQPAGGRAMDSTSYLRGHAL